MNREAVVEGNVRYAGFWIRTIAVLIDSIILAIVMAAIVAIVGANTVLAYAQTGLSSFIINWILPLLLTMLFWRLKGGTPGKMALSMKIVDANTLDKASWGQCFVRYIAYIVSTIPFLLGFFWIGWDKRKQSFHDKLAQTVVIRN